MKIVNIKKFLRSLSVILIFIFTISLICTKGTLSHKEVEYKVLYVENGDTLWSIARKLENSNSYYENKDIRYIIADLKEINNLESSNLNIGQELKIPII